MARRFDLATILRRRPPTPIGGGKLAVDKIKAQFETGHARANRYRVFLPQLENTTASASANVSIINSILCDSVTMPGRQITTNEYYTSMRATQIAYAFGLAPITISFYLTNNWQSWDYLNEWHKRVVTELDETKGYRLAFKKDYSRDIFIEHLDTEDNTTKAIQVMGAFPVTLNEIELGNANGDIIRATATFAYDNWTDIT